jgi:hypothetical protein
MNDDHTKPAPADERELPPLPLCDFHVRDTERSYFTAAQMRDYARSALAARAAPAGWQLVPIEPTFEMAAAGTGAVSAAPTHIQHSLTLICLRAMLAAAQQEPRP